MVKIKVRAKKQGSSQRQDKVQIVDVLKEHLSSVLLPGVFWLVFAGAMIFVPFVSGVITRQFGFLLALMLITIIFLAIVSFKKSPKFLVGGPSYVLLAFWGYVFIRWAFSDFSKYGFLDLAFITDVHPGVLVWGGLGLFLLINVILQLPKGGKHFLGSLPCIVVVADLLGWLAGLAPGFFAAPFKLVSINLYNLYLAYFKNYGVLSLYPDANFWLLVHLVAFLVLAPVLLKNVFERNIAHALTRGVIFVLLIWFLWLPIASITFSFVLGLALAFLGVLYIVLRKYSWRLSLVGLVGILVAVFLVLGIQLLFGIKKFTAPASFWGAANLAIAYKVYEKAVRANELVPGIYRGDIIKNFFVGLGTGGLGLLSGPLYLVLGASSYNGLLVLLLELGLLGVLFWLGIVYLFALRLPKLSRLTEYVSVVALLLALVWQLFSNVSTWSILFLSLLVYLADLITSQNVYELKGRQVQGIAKLVRTKAGAFLVLLLLLFPVFAGKYYRIVRDIYAVKLRKGAVESIKDPKEKYAKLEEAYKYAVDLQEVCKDCVYSKVLRLSLVNNIDDLLVQNKKVVKDLDLGTTYLEQVQDSLLVLSYELSSKVAMPDADVLSAYTFEKLSRRRKSELLSGIALAKYEDAITLNPNNYTLVYRYANFLLAQDSKKGDAIYNRLNTVISLLGRLAGTSQNLAFEVALLQARYHVKYGEYDKALKIYSTIKGWLTKQKFKDEKEKKKWLDAISALEKQVQRMQENKEKPQQGNNSEK